jgi:hypothetical protein
MKGDGIPLTPASGPLLPPRKDLFAGLPESTRATLPCDNLQQPSISIKVFA